MLFAGLASEASIVPMSPYTERRWEAPISHIVIADPLNEVRNVLGTLQ